MFSEDDLIAISALQHLLFCERQCALIHIEHVWEENRLTVEGKNLHQRVHQQESESRPGIRVARGLRLRSLRLGLVGMADAVEFHLKSEASGHKHCPGQPYPVEYKRGKPKPDHCDEVQLCAQALCLEEMLDVSIPAGALFYGTTHHRQEVALDGSLRDRTELAARRAHVLIESGVTPPPICGPKCDNCSLRDLCLPKETGGGHSVEQYMAQYLKESPP